MSEVETRFIGRNLENGALRDNTPYWTSLMFATKKHQSQMWVSSKSFTEQGKSKKLKGTHKEKGKWFDSVAWR
ncbi:MAG: hypothetical protein KME28_11665 [Pelatocladus maniniholoensis HA4357-MV3]|uniref:Uncharacterized protein n=1 Tax=Pelatocladus maniniholoensis HA4357-MV3 TaxID=1117104 RepID=A0A9E3H7Z3_9NOST|nr:hypothetical protein [Pelatocladus maniniholoensis HA4357-MV3]